NSALTFPRDKETGESTPEGSGIEAPTGTSTASSIDEALAALKSALHLPPLETNLSALQLPPLNSNLSALRLPPLDSNILRDIANTGVATANANGCKAFDTCYTNEDCPGGSCLGTFVGKCNCQGCKNLFSCKTDEDCGGLKGACTKLKYCDCNEGFAKAGFPVFFEAMAKFCNQKSCTGATAKEDCFGMESSCFPLFDDDDSVLVASGELTDNELTASNVKKYVRTTTAVTLKPSEVEGSGEAEVVSPESSLAKPQTADEYRTVAFSKIWKLVSNIEDVDTPGTFRCESDAACGGLKNACNHTTRTCNCFAGFEAAGYPFYVDALQGLCNKKSCTAKNYKQSCFGLPCHFGKCQC
ncbi:hypothetical protein GCK32_009106, partial [Trichostrongylus colubriformis]